MKPRTLALWGWLLLVAHLPIAADTKLITKLEGYTSLANQPASDWLLSALGRGRLDLMAQGAENTRGQLSLQLTFSRTLSLEVARAFVKYSLDGLRLTLGKAVLSWGEGLVFNAADLWVPDFNPAANLNAEVIKDTSLWLVGTYLPLGELSYLEVIGSPPALDIYTPSATPTWNKAAAGGRLYLDLGPAALQTAYVINGTDRRQLAALAFNTAFDNLNLYAAARTALPFPTTGQDPAADLWTGQTYSAGLFQSVDTWWEEKLNLRLEGLWQPGRAQPVTSLFGEAGFVLDDTQSLTLRLLVDPWTPSAKAVMVWSWQLDRGFTVLLLPSADWGPAWTWDKSGSPSLTAGFRLVL